MKTHPKDLTGMRFSRLTVAYELDRQSTKNPRIWMCQCDCGKSVLVRHYHLLDQRTRSCGCLKKEFRISENTTHSMSKTPIYKRWQDMMRRCYDPKRRSYKYYGARGIKVWIPWHKFETFLHDMGHPPNGASIERINNNGDYMPTNCKWAFPIDQQNNKRTSLRITVGGKTKSPRQWADETGVPIVLIQRNNYRSRPQIQIEQALAQKHFQHA